MNPFREFIVVKVPSVFLDETKYTGVEGKRIIVSVIQHPERHIRNFGEVVSVPDELLRYPLASDHTSAPAYHDYPHFSWKTTEDVELEIRVGDRAYFHYNCLLPDVNSEYYEDKWNKMFLYSKKEEENGKIVEYHYFRVKYDLVFATVRFSPANAASAPFAWWMDPMLKEFDSTIKDDETREISAGKRYERVDEHGFSHIYKKEITMIGSYVLIEPDKETWEDISIPTAVVVNGKILMELDGKTPKMRPKEEWIVVKSMPTEKYLMGWVRCTGSPLKGDRAFLKPGMYVHFQRHADTKMMFEGKEYFRMRQRHVFAIDTSKTLINAA